MSKLCSLCSCPRIEQPFQDSDCMVESDSDDGAFLQRFASSRNVAQGSRDDADALVACASEPSVAVTDIVARDPQSQNARSSWYVCMP